MAKEFEKFDTTLDSALFVCCVLVWPMMRRLAGLIALSVIALTCEAQSKHFDLKGDALGQSLESFKQVHPSARCYKNETERQALLGEDSCTVYQGVSFAGLPALSDVDCDRINAKVGDGHNCFEGISASFRNGKAIMLTYTVHAEGGQDWALQQVVSALTEKFGKPQTAARSWSNGTEVLLVHASEIPLGRGKEKASAISIILSTPSIILSTPEDSSKDI